MIARFRYVAADGREVEIATTEELVRALASGSLGRDTLLYDAYGGGWAPARNHSALLGRDLPDLSLTLAESPPEATAEVVAKLMRERASVARSSSQAPEVTVPLELVTQALGASLPERPEAAQAPPRRNEPSRSMVGARAESTHQHEKPVTPAGEIADEASRRRAAAAGPPKLRAREGSGPSWQRPDRRKPVVGMVGAVAGALVGLSATVFVFALLGDPAGNRPRGAPAQVVRDAAVAAGFGGPARTGASELTLVEDRALEDMVAGMERQQGVYRVDRVPSLWLEGIYLAEASRFPEVRSFWERYATYVEAMRAAEGEMFRQHLVERLQRGGPSESQLSMRVARALRTFNADFGRREAVYNGMLELSAAALDLHEFLLDNERQISYAPATAGVSPEPVTEAVAETRELRQEMNRALDRVLVALEATQGNRIAPKDEIPEVLRRGLVSREGAPMN